MKALIVGNNTEHDTLVKDSYLASYPNGEYEIYITNPISQTVFDYAIANDFDAIIYSYSGEESYFSLANSNPDIMIFMPSDSYNGDLQQLVLTDYYPTDDDYEFTSEYGGSQSNSNGYIAGQLFYIAEQRYCSLQEARICANATKSEDGIINVNSAIAYDGEIKLSVRNLTVERTSGFSTTVTIERVIDATSYEIDINGTIYTTAELTYSYTLPTYDRYTFKYRGINADLQSDWSDEVTLVYTAGKYLRVD